MYDDRSYCCDINISFLLLLLLLMLIESTCMSSSRRTTTRASAYTWWGDSPTPYSNACGSCSRRTSFTATWSLKTFCSGKRAARPSRSSISARDALNRNEVCETFYCCFLLNFQTFYLNFKFASSLHLYSEPFLPSTRDHSRHSIHYFDRHGKFRLVFRCHSHVLCWSFKFGSY